MSGKILNCFIHGNKAGHCGGGVQTYGSSLIENCLISNNWIYSTYYKSSGIVGGGAALDAGEMRNCHVVSNFFLSNIVGYNGGGFGVAVKNGGFVHDCLIEFNHGKNGVLSPNLQSSGTKQSVVSNCLVRYNRSYGSGTLFNVYSEHGASVLLTDCIVVSNTGPHFVHAEDAGWGGSVPSATFRNIYAYDNALNKDGSMVHINIPKGKAETSKYTFENCTFAKIAPATTSKIVLEESSADGKGDPCKVYLTRCAFWNCCKNTLCDVGDIYKFSCSTNHVNYCLLPSVPANLSGTGNMVATGDDAVDPKFADAANGDFRLQADSPLVDAGGEASAWMGTGRRRGPQDMGDGSYTILKSGKYGVAIRRNSPQARLRGAAPDIGCFEYRPLKGAAVFVK